MKGFLICLFITVPCFLFGSRVFAQTADRIEWLLRQNRVNYGEAALLTLEASGRLDPASQTRPEAAFNLAMENGWLPKGAQAANEARLSGLSLLVMRAFDIKGGALFALFKNPHYAYRALVYRGIIRGRADPAMFVSGDLLLYTVNKAMDQYGTGSNEK